MTDFLLELLSEEIPARMQAKARNDLARLFADEMQAASLAFESIESFSTPRRLGLIARNVADATEDFHKEFKGPRVGAPDQAIDGFLRKVGLTKDFLEERDGIFYAVIAYKGRTASEVIANAVVKIIAEFPWPKSMRWGDGELRWVRPLHSIIALLGADIVPIAVAGITSGATTLGHRFHHPGPITIGGAKDYAEKLRACHVLVDQEEREALIRDGAAKAAAEAGLTLIEDEGLVVENAGLTEWPVPLLGHFDPDFLDVPREVIVLTMRTNQKYFACIDDSGALAPAFVCVSNIDANDGGTAIIEGNRRVLAARLADARFFWEQDVKIPLEEQAKKLDGIVFHEKLGTVADKVERVAKLARWLIEEGIVGTLSPAGRGQGEGAHVSSAGAEPPYPNPLPAGEREQLADQAERAARLAKADLVTGMVGEFPELQGVIGGYLAAAQGEPKAIADAIRDHYKPIGLWDGEPSLSVSVALALADKLDTLFAFFDAGMLPTGSKDPFALRRAAIGVIRIIERNALRLLISEAARSWNTNHTVGPGLAVEDFLQDRMAVMMKDSGFRSDTVRASSNIAGLSGERFDGDLWRVRRRAQALQSFLETGEGTNLLAGYKRAANILKKEEGSWTPDQVRGDDVKAEEAALTKALDKAEPKATIAIEKEDFTAAMAALASLRGPIDAFFDAVKVNADDKGTRARRLNLLARFRDAVNRVADFSKIEG